jgi:putative SOS response-associated peptidase YedK
MPVILDPEAESRWLDASTPVERLPSLLSSLTAEQTALHPVGRAVNDARYDGPECLAAPEPDGQEALF